MSRRTFEKTPSLKGTPSLGEEETEPVEDSGLRQVLVRVPQLNKTLQSFLSSCLPDSEIREGAGKVTKFFYDKEMRLPHIWIYVETVSYIDEDFEAKVRKELEEFSEVIAHHFPKRFAVSAHIKRRKETTSDV